MEEATLIEDVIHLTERISLQPVDRLRLQCTQIERLRTITDNLYKTVRSSSDETSPSPSSTSPTHSTAAGSPRSRHVSASRALSIACRSALSLIHILRKETPISFLDQSRCDGRLAHLQQIFSLQKSQNKSSSDLEDRLLLTCSCVSLARDFRSYESTLGHIPRHDLAFERILAGQDPAIQQNGKLARRFLEMLCNNVHKDKFEAGLRLGTKLNLVEFIGEHCGLGSGLSLIMGYECSQLARMPYREMVQLCTLLRSSDVDVRPLQAVCDEFGELWTSLRNSYHSRHSSEAKPQASVDMILDDMNIDSLSHCNRDGAACTTLASSKAGQVSAMAQNRGIASESHTSMERAADHLLIDDLCNFDTTLPNLRNSDHNNVFQMVPQFGRLANERTPYPQPLGGTFYPPLSKYTIINDNYGLHMALDLDWLNGENSHTNDVGPH